MKGLFKKVLVFFAVMMVVALGGWFGRKAYRKSAERRLTNEATDYLHKKDYRNALLCLQRALQINPMSTQSSRMMGDMLEQAGSDAALNWRIRTYQLQPEITNRFAWAQTALKFKNVPSAAEALKDVDEKSKSGTVYHQLMGTFAWMLGRPAEAEQNYIEACRLEPDNVANTFNLNTIRLAFTNTTVAHAARAALLQLTTNSEIRLPVYQLLVRDAVSRKAFGEAFQYSQALVKDPEVSFDDKIGHLQLCRETKIEHYESWLTSLKAEAAKSPKDAFALGKWMAAVESPTNSLRWLRTLDRGIQTNQPVPLIITDCQIALKDWKGVLQETRSQNWGETEFYRLALESLAQRSLGETAASETSWRKSLRLAEHHLERLSRLAQVTAIWSWKTEHAGILSEIVSAYPKESWALDQLAAQLYTDGKTRELQDLYAKVYAADPSNARLKNNLASLAMLRKSDLPNAYRLAEEAYQTSNTDPFFASTYAYSLLLQNKPDEALKILGGIKPEYLRIPSVAAYYGVIQVRSGKRDAAREPLQLAAAAKLLPEEKEMVRLAAAEVH